MKKNKNHKFKNQLNPSILITVTIGLIICILGYGVYLLMSNNKNILIDSSKEIVYTGYENKDYDKVVPTLNMKGLSTEVNNSIKDFVSPYIDEPTNIINYHYQINGNILSLFINIEDYAIEGSADVHYKSFIINLKKAKLLTNEEVLKIFDIDADVLKTNLDKQFKAYYEDEIANQIISSSVSYEEYLKAHEITDFLNEMYYDIKDGKLNVYLDYNEWTNLETENYFVGIGHVFEVE